MIKAINIKAMHEALEAINSINTGGLRRLLVELVEADIFDGGHINRTISAVERARHALATPPRNCDVGSDKEQAERFNQFCESHPYKDGVGCRCANCELDCCDCEIAWSQMPYEEAK